MSSSGMEVASYLSNKAATVAMVGTTEYPFEKSLGPEIGRMTMRVRTPMDSLNSIVTATQW